MGTNSVGSNYHTFYDTVGIALKGGSIHESSRVTFISIANYVFCISRVTAA